MLRITDVRAVPGDAAFLLDDGETAVLYDTGFAFTGFAVADNIEKVLGGRSLDYILLTHSHYDHAAGSAYIAKRFPKVRIAAAEYAGRIFAKPTARAAMRELDRKAAAQNGVTDYPDHFDDLRVDIPVKEGDVLRCGKMEFTVIALPGHTKCSVGYYLASEKLLLSCETLGVYFGKGTYLPSCLVGYQMTLDSLERAKKLQIDKLLLPHYGLSREPPAEYLKKAEAVCRAAAERMLSELRAGRTRDEIVDGFVADYHRPHVAPVYPIDAFRLNTGIMAELIAAECMDQKERSG